VILFAIASLLIAQPAPDSLIITYRTDTLTSTELRIFPPPDAELPLYYQAAWGDGDTSDWVGPVQSRVDAGRYHQYRRSGEYEVSARVKDQAGRVSDWGKHLPVVVTTPVLKWSFSVGDTSPVVSSPAVDEKGNVYFGDETGWFFSLDPGGNLRWKYLTANAIYASPSVWKGLVYLPAIDSHQYCFDTQGKLRWKTYLGDELYGAAALDPKGNAYVTGDAGTLYAVAANGKLRWKYQVGEECSSAPSIGINGLIYVSAESVLCIDGRGRRRWGFSPPEEGYFYGSPVPDLKGSVYAGNDDGYLYLIGPDGRMRWRSLVPDEDEIRTEPCLGPGDTVYYGSEGYHLVRKAPKGQSEVMYEADDILIGTPAISDSGTVYFLPDDGVMYAQQSTGRLVWKADVAAEEKSLYYTSAPCIAPDGTVYVGSWDGAVYAFDGNGAPARSLWPQYRHDAQHTGRLTKPRRR